MIRRDECGECGDDQIMLGFEHNIMPKKHNTKKMYMHTMFSEVGWDRGGGAKN